MITIEGLKAMPLDEPIGEDVVNDIEVMANTGLSHFIKKSFEPCEGVYRIDDFGDYVPYEDWRKFWSAFPEWCEWVFFCTTMRIPMTIGISPRKYWAG